MTNDTRYLSDTHHGGDLTVRSSPYFYTSTEASYRTLLHSTPEPPSACSLDRPGSWGHLDTVGEFKLLAPSLQSASRGFLERGRPSSRWTIRDTFIPTAVQTS